MTELNEETKPIQKPKWLRRKLPTDVNYGRIHSLLKKDQLNTVCREARCPNQWECFSKRTATFLIMGSKCTRNCGFCAVQHGPTEMPDPGEPERVALAVKEMGLRYVVVTSVTRDDLSDGGASCFSQTIHDIRNVDPDIRIEVLIPDFKGDKEALQIVLCASPQVLNHNIETCKRLYPKVRPDAGYSRSLDLIKEVSTFDSTIITKSGMMLGLGETYEEIEKTFQDLLNAGCRMLTLGQYLQPSKGHLSVERFVPPAEFESWREIALNMGFSEVSSGPLVRSSYHANTLYSSLTVNS